MWFAEIFVIGYNSWLEVFVPFPSVDSLGLPNMTALKKTTIHQFITAGLVSVSLRPRHHEQTEAAAQRKAQNERKGRSENREERGQTHAGEGPAVTLRSY